MQIQANGLRIEVDDQGPTDGPVVLLIMGLGMQLIAWPQALVQALTGRGFRVVRFDNRDIGLSQGFDAAGVPNIAVAIGCTCRCALHTALPIWPVMPWACSMPWVLSVPMCAARPWAG